MECNRPFGMRRRRPATRGKSVAPVGVDDPRLMGLLGLPVADHDPVTIITAAQIRLRRWRRLLNADAVGTAPDRTAAANDRIRRIKQARDALLQRVVTPGGTRVCN